MPPPTTVPTTITHGQRRDAGAGGYFVGALASRADPSGNAGIDGALPVAPSRTRMSSVLQFGHRSPSKIRSHAGQYVSPCVIARCLSFTSLGLSSKNT